MEKAICAVDKINNLTPRPQFVVICGDLINELSDGKQDFNLISLWLHLNYVQKILFFYISAACVVYPVFIEPILGYYLYNINLLRPC
jgi:hypothetical protein